MNKLQDDSCQSCPFNSAILGEYQDSSPGAGTFRCEIRNFTINQPSRTYCNNHPLRNPLLRKSLRGPVWAAVPIFFDSKPLRQDLKMPPQFVPPQAEGSSFRIPYYKQNRPREDYEGVCIVCQDSSERTLSLNPEEGKIHYCSVAHYFEWWLMASPEAVSLRSLKLPDPKIWEEKFKTVPGMLSESLMLLKAGEWDWIYHTLCSIEDLLMEQRKDKMHRMHNALFSGENNFDDRMLRDTLSPLILKVQTELNKTGKLLREKQPDREAVARSITSIAKTIGSYLRRSRE